MTRKEKTAASFSHLRTCAHTQLPHPYFTLRLQKKKKKARKEHFKMWMKGRRTITDRFSQITGGVFVKSVMTKNGDFISNQSPDSWRDRESVR